MFLKKYGVASIKAVAHSAFFATLLGAVMLLYANNWISDKVSFFMIVFILILSASVYSIVKGNVPKSLLYNFIAAISFVIINLSVIVVLGAIYVGWETLMFYWTGIFSACAYLFSIIIDSVVCLVKRKKKSADKN